MRLSKKQLPKGKKDNNKKSTKINQYSQVRIKFNKGNKINKYRNKNKNKNKIKYKNKSYLQQIRQKQLNNQS